MRSGFLTPVFIRTHMIMLSEFPAKIAGTCKSRFFRDGGDGFLRSMEQFGRLCQPVLNEICYRGGMNTGLKNMQCSAFADGCGRCDHIQGYFFRKMVMNVLHHSL